MAFVLRRFGRTLPSLGSASLRGARRQVIGDKQYCSTGNDASEDSENKAKIKAKAEEKRKAAKLKLNDLLESIQKTSAVPSDKDGGVSGRLARPGRQPRPRHVVARPDRPAPASAASAAAPTQPPPVKQLTLDEEVAQAARDVASSLGGDTARTEAELLFKLNGEDGASADRPQLSELMSGMKVDQRPAPGRSQQVRHLVGERRADAVGRVRRERAETPGQQRRRRCPDSEGIRTPDDTDTGF
ncbi:uncharacterized protein LOC119100558 [Pollicipes pollicipes]|uniref:uncharacterized protein LOC119100558 n=1 Tax=Pollicipes pollicipes TaxID=41117 RepID=UPI00188553C5|nr:uncharacterized protein LOC119100558 [Pollicipes pollicipes]